MNARFGKAILILALLAPTSAAAAEPTSVRDALTSEARAEFDEASRLYREARYAEARDIFLSTYARSGEPRVLYNVAVCDKALGRYKRAIETLKRSLVTTDRALPAEYTERVAEAIATLSRYVAFVRVESTVPDVVFVVDGEPIRENPVALETGPHTFVATKDGYEPKTVTLTVRAGQTERIALDPEPSTRPGTAKITCAGVPACEIRVGDEVLGNAPVTLSRSAGSYLVRATVDGREWSQQRIELQNGTAIEITLTGRTLSTARLRVTTGRADDTITVDGSVAGRSGIGLDLAPGEHHVVIARRDGATRSIDVLLRENETRDLRIELEEKKGFSPWWLVGGGVLLAGAATTVAFLMAQPTKFEGSAAGTLNPFVVPASLFGGGATR